ncbi:hypothetical protein F5148DRAFT_266593 [Russula earlei]|uniref:Uncharacterized protein n=1 Tax=Russula earlei TaxID=71964 RepID=A0ACC0UJJ2_9AGAM|nr:hypothetical protein F5148DRAFT_266593 [Russula earlei]
MKLMNIAQGNAVRATDALAETLQMMNDTVMNALVDINATAMRVTKIVGGDSNSFYSNVLSLARTTVIQLKHIPLLRLLAPTVVELLWFILRHSRSFIVMPCLVAIISVLRWLLRKILPGHGFKYSRPCVCDFKASLERSQYSTARSTPCARRRPFEWRSSKFSRIPDRLCERRLDY